MSSPKFNRREELARYINPDERDGDNHAAASAFLLSPTDLKKPEEAHLSVNSTELESLANIAAYHRSTQQDGEGEISVCIHKVHKYIDSGRKAGAVITKGAGVSWEFNGKNQREPAFKHRPVRPVKETARPGSPSHCGVEFLRCLDDLQQRRFARLMARRPRFQIFG